MGLMVKAKTDDFNATMLFKIQVDFHQYKVADNDSNFNLVFSKVLECVGDCAKAE